MHPTPEQIKSMLIYEAPTPVQEVVNHYRVLLEENERLKREMSVADDTISLLDKGLENVREERDDWKNQLKALSDTAWESALEDMKVKNENVTLRNQLSKYEVIL